MYSPDETVGRRRNWGAVYTILFLTGVTVLTPSLTPQTLSLSNWLLLVWGGLMVVGFGPAAIAAFTGRTRFVWVENSGAWLGNAGVSIYVTSVLQTILVEGMITRVPLFLGYLALLVILVSRSFRLQRNLKTERRVREIVRIAQRNDRH